MKQLPQSSAWVIMLVVVITISLACGLPGMGGETTPVADSSGPQVTLISPNTEQKLESGREIKVQSTSIDATTGIVRVELLIDNQVMWVDANPQPQPDTPYIVAQPWTPEIPGSHVIQVRAYNTDNVAGQSEPLVVQVVALAQAVDDEASPSTDEAEVNTPTNTPLSVVEATASPTLTPPSSSTTPMPTLTPTSTTTPTVTPTPTSTPTPGTFANTGIKSDGRFKDVWSEVGGGDGRLGYPTGPEIKDRDFARQYFEQGLMYWWDNPDGPDYIWVIDSPATDLRRGKTWNRYVDTWDGGDEYACDQARRNGDKGPRRGFGKLWCERPELQTRLGNPREGEAGSGGSPPYGHVQFYQGGVMLYNPLNAEVFVLFDQGDWLRFGY
jgi:hypothetical protein